MFSGTYSEMLNGTIGGLKREDIQKLFDLIEETRSSGKHLFVFDNGGSAATASHWVCDFGKGINRGDSKRLKIFSPADNGTIFNALGNDCGYETTSVEQVKDSLESGDLILTFSVSGGLSNLVEAHRYAKEIDAETTCVVVDKDGKIIGTSGFVMIIPSKSYGVVEDVHVILEHAISQQTYVDNVKA